MSGPGGARSPFPSGDFVRSAGVRIACGGGARAGFAVRRWPALAVVVLLVVLCLVTAAIAPALAQDGGPAVEVEIRDDVTPFDPGTPVPGGLAAWVADGAGPADAAASALPFDGAGRVRLPFEGPGRVLLVWAPSRAPVAIRVNAPIGFTLAMKRSLSTTVRVTNSAGAAIAGADVAAEMRLPLVHARSDQGEFHTIRRTVRTDGNGDARIEGLGGEAISVSVSADGWSGSAPPPFDPRTGAVVVLVRGSRVAGSLRVQPGGAAPKDAHAHLGPLVARLDAEGRWAFEHVAPGAWPLRFSGRGFTPAPPQTIVLDDGNDRVGLDVSVPASSSFAGRVVLPADRSAELLRVELAFPPSVGAAPVTSEVRPDAGGRFRIEDLVACDGAVVTVSAEGFVPARATGVSLPSGGEARETEFPLRLGGTVTGLLADPDGRPLAGVAVAAWPARGTSGAELGSAASDDAARFRITGVRPGVFWLRPAGRPAASWAGPFEVAEDETADLGEIRVFMGHHAAGRVTGAPEGAELVVLREGAEFSRVPVVHEQFSLEGLPPGPVMLRAEHAGETGGSAEVRIPVAWAIVFPWDAAVTLTGRLIDRDGRPVSAATLRAERLDGDDARTLGIRDVDGAFSLRLPRGRWRIDATSAADGAGAVTDVTLPGDASRPVTLVLERGALLRGILAAAEDGHPIEGATVSVVSSGDRPARALARTDANGRFALAGVPAGAASVRIATADRGIQTLEPRAVRENEDIDLGRIELARGTSVRGEVWLTGGAPMSRGEVRFECDGGTVRTSRTDEFGRFAAAGLPPGGTLVTVRDREGTRLRSQRMTVPATWDDWRLRIDLAAGTIVRGRIVGDPGACAFARVVLRFTSPSVLEVATTSDANGTFELPPVPPGAGEIEAIPAGARAGAWRPVSVTGGVFQTVQIDFTEGSVNGRVEARDGGFAVPRAVVELTDHADGRLVSSAVTGDDGRFELTGVPRGSYDLDVRRDGYGPPDHAPRVHVTLRREAPLRVRLLPEGRFTITVRDPALRPVTTAWAAAWPAGIRGRSRGAVQPAATAMADPDGRIELRGVSEGAWDIRVGAPGRATRSLGLVRGEAGVRDLGEVVLDRGTSLRVIPFVPPGHLGARSDGRLPGIEIVVLDVFDSDPRGVRRPDDFLRGRDSAWVAGPDGVVDLTGLSPGTYQIFPLGRPDARMRVRVRPDTVGTVWLPVPPEPPDGTPPGGR